MIVYDLICEKEHKFESWFKNSSAYDFLRKTRKISCPVCNSTKIKKAPMAPNISRSVKKDITRPNKIPSNNQKMQKCHFRLMFHVFYSNFGINSK